MGSCAWWNDHGAPRPMIGTSGTRSSALPFALIRQPQGTVVPIFLMKTKLVLTGESKTAIVRAIASALDKGKLPALASGAMCYMMSKQQYLSDQGKSWHPHLMFFCSGQRGNELGRQSAGLARHSGG